MFNVMIWCVYGIFVGSIVKALVPGEEKLGFLQTIALGVVGSYVGGACLYLLGEYSSLSPAGVFMGIAGGVLALMVYNKVTKLA